MNRPLHLRLISHFPALPARSASRRASRTQTRRFAGIAIQALFEAPAHQRLTSCMVQQRPYPSARCAALPRKHLHQPAQSASTFAMRSGTKQLPRLRRSPSASVAAERPQPFQHQRARQWSAASLPRQLTWPAAPRKTHLQLPSAVLRHRVGAPSGLFPTVQRPARSAPDSAPPP